MTARRPWPGTRDERLTDGNRAWGRAWCHDLGHAVRCRSGRRCGRRRWFWRGGCGCPSPAVRAARQHARVTVVSAPAGSGKTVLLRSWIGEAGLAGSAAWVSVGARSVIRSGSGCRCSTRCARRRPGRRWCGELTAAPDLDGWAIVERLLKDLAPLEDRFWLVIDDVHELGSAEALRAAGAAGDARAAGAAVRARHPA